MRYSPDKNINYIPDKNTKEHQIKGKKNRHINKSNLEQLLFGAKLSCVYACSFSVSVTDIKEYSDA